MEILWHSTLYCMLLYLTFETAVNTQLIWEGFFTFSAFLNFCLGQSGPFSNQFYFVYVTLNAKQNGVLYQGLTNYVLYRAHKWRTIPGTHKLRTISGTHKLRTIPGTHKLRTVSRTHKLRTILGTHKLCTVSRTHILITYYIRSSQITYYIRDSQIPGHRLLYRDGYCGGSLESKLLHVTLLAPGIFEVDPDFFFFWKICAPLFYVITIMESYSNEFFWRILKRTVVQGITVI